MAPLKAGEPAPNFNKESTQGPIDLTNYRGRWLVLFFYPKDFTSGCTKEVCDFRDLLPGMDADVVGVSPDPVDRHLAFQEEYALPFPLLADEDHALAEAYGAWGEKTSHGRSYQGLIRSTFIIDPQGMVAEAMHNVQADGHAGRVRERLTELRE